MQAFRERRKEIMGEGKLDVPHKSCNYLLVISNSQYGEMCGYLNPKTVAIERAEPFPGLFWPLSVQEGEEEAGKEESL